MRVSSATTIAPAAGADAHSSSTRLSRGGTRSRRCEVTRNGTTLALFPKPEGTKAEHTAVSFKVGDIGAAIRELKARGVEFADYDFPGFKTVEHVCVLGSEKAAWFEPVPQPTSRLRAPSRPASARAWISTACWRRAMNHQ